MIVGRSPLGLAHRLFPVDEFIRVTPAGGAICVFDDPFGPVLPKLRKCIDALRPIAVEIQAHWSDSHDIVPVEKLKAKLPAYNKLALEVGDRCKVYISHSCEHNGSAEEAKIRMALIRNLAPNCIPVNNPWRGASLPGEINEKHVSPDRPGARIDMKGQYIINTDGASLYDMDAEKFLMQYSNALMVFGWALRDNLREIPDKGQKVPRPGERTAAPDRPYLISVQTLLMPKGPIARPKFKAIPLKKPMLWKTHAEDDQEENPLEPDDPRENKPCLIIPYQAQVVDVLAANGKVIGTLGYGGRFIDGQHRYYSGAPGGSKHWGFQLAKLAQKLTGSGYVWFRAGRQIIGPVHGAFRDGYFPGG